MSEKAKIGAIITLDGEKAYRQAITDINKSHSVLRSEMKLVKAEFEGQEKSVSALRAKQDILQKQYDEQTKKVATLRGALQDVEKQYGENSNQVQTWKIKLNNALTDLTKLDRELGENKDQLKNAENATDDTAKSIDKYENEINNATSKTAIFGDVLKANLASELIIAGVKKLSDGIKVIATNSIGVGKEFEASMSQVAATIGITADEIESGSESFKKLQDAAKQAGATTKYSATDAADALNYLALAGYDVNESIDNLPTILNLAAAGDMELASASDMLTNSMTALGDMAGTSSEFVDKMAIAAQKSNADVSQLGEAILTVGGTARDLAGGTTELNAALGILADSGIKSAEGGTALRNIILALEAPTDVAAEAMESLGFSAFDSNGKLRPLNESFLDLNDRLSSLNQQKRAEILSTIFNKVDLKSANALLANSGERFDELSGYIDNADGAAQSMAETMSDNLNGRLDNLDSALEGVGITIYDKFQEPLKNAVDSATDGFAKLDDSLQNGKLGEKVDKLAQSFGNASEDVIDFAIDALPAAIDGMAWIIDNGGAVAGGIAAGTAAWGAYKLIVEQVAIKEALLKTTLFTNPVGVIAAGVATLTTALIMYSTAQVKAKDATSAMLKETDKLIEKGDEFAESYENAAQARKENIENIETEAGASKTLADNLFDLAEKEHKSSQEKAVMKELVNQLNELMPDLNLTIDEQTGLISKNREEVEKSIEANLEYLKVEAAREDLKELAKEQYEAEKILNEQTEQRSRLVEELSGREGKLADAKERLRAQQESGLPVAGQYVLAVKDQENAIKNMAAKVEEADAAITEQQGIVSSIKGEFDSTSQYIGAFESAESSAAGATDEMKFSLVEFGGKSYEVSQTTAESFNVIIEKYAATKEAAIDSIQSQLGLFDEFNAKQAFSKEQMLQNLNSQIEGMTNWSNDIQVLSDRGINQGLLKTLKEMGPESYKYTHTLVTMSDEEIGNLNDLYSNKMNVAESVATEMTDAKMNMDQKLQDIKDEASNLAGAMSSAGTNSSAAFADQFNATWDSKVPHLEARINNLASKSRQILDIHSPSRVFRKIGEQTGEGLELGAVESLESAQKSVELQIEKMKNVNTELPYNEVQFKYMSAFTDSIPKQGDEISTMRRDVLDILSVYLPQIANKSTNLYIDKNELVGSTISNYDVGLAERRTILERGGCI